MNGFWQSILINVIIPELAGLFRRDPGATDEEALAAAEAAYQRVVTAGEAFLASKGIAGPINALPPADGK